MLITDGEDHDSFPIEAARAAGERGVKILAMGLGDSQEGARIPLRQASGELKYLQHEGQIVWSKLHGDLLEKIALETGGAYIPAGTRAYDLGQLYEQHLVGLSRGEYRQEKRQLLKEQFQWPLAGGVVLLMIEILIPTYLRPRQIVGIEVPEMASSVGKSGSARQAGSTIRRAWPKAKNIVAWGNAPGIAIAKTDVWPKAIFNEPRAPVTMAFGHNGQEFHKFPGPCPRLWLNSPLAKRDAIAQHRHIRNRDRANSLNSLARFWEGEAPAEPHHSSANGSAGASPSRRPTPRITTGHLGVSPTWILTLALLPALTASTAAQPAYDQVRQGIRKYEAKDYAAAARSFDDALATSPENMRIVYNQACVATARDQLDRAVELFQQAAIADDPQLASACRYNLGVIAARRARTTFGAKPEESDEQKRTEGLEQLALAVAHYRDCLSLDPAHGQARHNLELIRLWIKNMEQIWRQRDRQRRRDQMDLMAFLRYIDGEQRGLRSTNRSLARLPDSPKRRQAVRVTATAQRELAEEITPLQQKIEAAVDAALQAAAGAAGQGGPAGQAGNDTDAAARREAQLRPLRDLADEAGRQMASAATQLVNQQLIAANDAETSAIERLDELFMQLTDFGSLLERSIDEQQTLVDRVSPAVEASGQSSPLDGTDLAWRQRFVEDWARMLLIKAQAGLARLAPPDAAGAATQPGREAASAAEQATENPEAQKRLAAAERIHGKGRRTLPGSGSADRGGRRPFGSRQGGRGLAAAGRSPQTTTSDRRAVAEATRGGAEGKGEARREEERTAATTAGPTPEPARREETAATAGQPSGRETAAAGDDGEAVASPPAEHPGTQAQA